MLRFFCRIIIYMLTFGLLVNAYVFAAASADDDPFALDYIEEELLSKRLDQIPVLSPGDEGAMKDVPTDHWAYAYVKHLIDIGLLGGYEDGRFRGNEPVTRYELAAIVSKLITNYNTYLQTGSFVVPEPQTAGMAIFDEPVSVVDSIATEPADAGTNDVATSGESVADEPAPLMTLKKRTVISGIAPGVTPGEVTLAPKPRMGVFVTSGMKTLGPEPEKTGGAKKNEGDEAEIQKAAATDNKKTVDGAKDEKKATASKKTGKKKTGKKKDNKAAKDKEKYLKKLPKDLKKLDKDVKFTNRDLEILLALIKYVEKGLIRDAAKDLKKEIGSVKRTAQRNERDIEKLEEQNQRFKITGSGTVNYERRSRSCPYPNCSCGTDNADCKTTGTPWKSLSLNQYSKPRKFDDMTLTSRFNNSYNLHIKYQDFTTDRNNPRNFKLRSLNAGRVSFGSSPLTTLGRSIDGFVAELKLNDYTIKGAVGTHSGDSGNYIYAANITFNLFGEVKSWAYITRISSYDKNETDESKWGYWNGGDSSVKLPWEKNSVNSIYIRYPMPVKNLYITTEYAHSTYNRPGFKMPFPSSESDPPGYDAWDDYWSSIKSTWTPGQQFKTWIDIPEQRDQDDAFFVLFDYNKGPLTIFPMGYLRLGHNFVSKSLGLPGFNTDDFGIDVIPINLQSLEIFVLMGSYKKLEDHYNYDFLFVNGGETEPMFFDTSAAGSSMSTLVGFNLFARMNSRGPESTLELSYNSHKLTYYLTDDISVSGKYEIIKAGLPETCLDGNYTEVIDDDGNVIDKFIGDGIADCVSGADDLLIKLMFSQKKQSYNMFWRTSKKSEFSLDYGFNDSRINAVTSIPSITSAINDLVPQGKQYWIKSSVRYKLTDVSRVELWMNQYYGRPDLTLTKEDERLDQRIGMKVYMSF